MQRVAPWRQHVDPRPESREASLAKAARSLVGEAARLGRRVREFETALEHQRRRAQEHSVMTGAFGADLWWLWSDPEDLDRPFPLEAAVPARASASCSPTLGRHHSSRSSHRKLLADPQPKQCPNPLRCVERKLIDADVSRCSDHRDINFLRILSRNM